MRESERLSALIGHIYDAALDPTLWVDALGEAAQFVGGSGASLYHRDAAARNPDVTYQFGIAPRYVQLYLNTYAKLDPTALGYFFAKLEEPTVTADVMAYDEFVQSRFYREWVRPQKWVDTVNAMLERSTNTAVGFVVFRREHEGRVNEETRQRMRLVVPHMRRAALIGKTLQLHEARSVAFSETFDAISAGIFLVGADGRAVHANAAGTAMLNSADVLRPAAGRIVASDPDADLTLSEILAAAGNGDAAIGVRGIAVPLSATGGDRYVAHVLPLTSGIRRRAGTAFGAAVALFVHKAALNIPSPPEVIAKAYKLTPTELRVLLAVVGVGGVPEVAEALGIAQTTVKYHLGSVYKKTGRSRQADLVKLVAEFSNPLIQSR